MDQIKLRKLLSSPEGPNLEFKRYFHAIKHADPIVKGYQRDELIRDIVSLANNNTSTAGDNAYLIIGADDRLDEDGKRQLFDVDKSLPDESKLLDIINPAIDPPLAQLICEWVEMDGKRLYVITIPPDGNLHETRRQLKTGENTYYSEHVVFIRHGEKIGIASAKERAAIQELRRKRAYQQNIPLTLFIMIVAVFIGVTSAVNVAKSSTPQLPFLATLIIVIVGALVFGFFGYVVSGILKMAVEVRVDWYRYNKPQKIVVGIFGFLVGIGLLYMWFFR
jgi:hypothetical protein